MTVLGTIENTVTELRRIRSIVGDCACSWEDYRREMVAVFGIDPDAIDTLHRLGWFTIGDNFVRFNS